MIRHVALFKIFKNLLFILNENLCSYYHKRDPRERWGHAVFRRGRAGAERPGGPDGGGGGAPPSADGVRRGRGFVGRGGGAQWYR